MNCVLAGESALLLQCATLLERRGFRVDAVVSEDPSVQAWAGRTNRRLCTRIGDVEAFVAGRRYDWLFSIVNPYVLGAEVLACAVRGAVNYHDSLLPRYAGSHAVPWALIHGESQVGVSWHLMGQRADAGDLLAQSVVAVARGETAQSLNGKCALAAIASFGKVLTQLAEPLRPMPQGRESRSFFYRFRRPTPAALIDFARPALEIERYVRALTFGTQFNPLGVPKMIAGGRVLLVDSAEALAAEDASRPPGHVVPRSSGHELHVATSDGEVRLCVREDPFLAEPVADVGGPILEAGAWESLSSFDRSVFKYERHWLNQFRDRPSLLGMRRGPARPRRWLAETPGALALHACARLLRAMRDLAPAASVDLWVPAGVTPAGGAATALYALDVPLPAPAEDLPEDERAARLERALARNASCATYLLDLEERVRATTPHDAAVSNAIAVHLRLETASDPPEVSRFAICVGRGRRGELWVAGYGELPESSLRAALTLGAT